MVKCSFDRHQHLLQLQLLQLLPGNCAGLHGAAVVITGRRPAVLQEAVQALESEGIRAHGIQVCTPRPLYNADTVVIRAYIEYIEPKTTQYLLT